MTFSPSANNFSTMDIPMSELAPVTSITLESNTLPFDQITEHFLHGSTT